MVALFGAIHEQEFPLHPLKPALSGEHPEIAPFPAQNKATDPVGSVARAYELRRCTP